MANYRKNVQPLIPQGEIARRVAELGFSIAADYAGKELVLVGLLKGAFPFIADLARSIDLDFQVSFMTVSSYGAGQVSSGEIKIVQDIDCPIEGKHVLIVEDIVDTGQTLARVIGHLQARSPASVRVCTMLDKPSRRVVDLAADYVGFAVEDLFVVGYGMDLGGLYRNLPYIGVYSG
jgi:hypoxanthine phosphoribosyltransferase